MHESLWCTNRNLTYVGPDGVILDDKILLRRIGLSSCSATLPRVCHKRRGQYQAKGDKETTLEEILSELEEDIRSGEEDYSDEVKVELGG